MSVVRGRESSNEIDQPSKIGSAGHIIMLNSRGLHKFTFQNSFDLVYSHFVAVNFHRDKVTFQLNLSLIPRNF